MHFSVSDESIHDQTVISLVVRTFCLGIFRGVAKGEFDFLFGKFTSCTELTQERFSCFETADCNATSKIHNIFEFYAIVV